MTKLLSASVIAATLVSSACRNVDTATPAANTTAGGQGAPAAPAAAASLTDQQQVNPAGTAMLEFKERVDVYLKIHNEAEEKVPNLKKTDDPKEISDRERALADMIMTLRAGAKPGDVFSAEVRPYLIKIIQQDFQQRSAADRKALVNELPAKVTVDVNTVYPTTLPLETFPPALLRKLPDLPPELEYRIVGRSLILRDVKANLIVDILRDVVPTIPS